MTVLRIATLGILIALAITGGAFTAALVGATNSLAQCESVTGDCKNQGP